jgi:hypothetical protein
MEKRSVSGAEHATSNPDDKRSMNPMRQTSQTKESNEFPFGRVIIRHHDGTSTFALGTEEMAELSGAVFPLRERVPGTEGDAFDFAAWYAAWTLREGLAGAPEPTHLNVVAGDSFEATIPWSQLQDAAVLFRVAGEPLRRGGPVRLYVPNGTSACLNVKNVIAFRTIHDPESGDDSEYGFRNVFSPEELRKPQS